MIRKSLVENAGFSDASLQAVQRDAARVHLELLDRFIALTERARTESSSDFLSDSLDDQVEWLSNLKSSYLV